MSRVPTHPAVAQLSKTNTKRKTKPQQSTRAFALVPGDIVTVTDSMLIQPDEVIRKIIDEDYFIEEIQVEFAKLGRLTETVLERFERTKGDSDANSGQSPAATGRILALRLKTESRALNSSATAKPASSPPPIDKDYQIRFLSQILHGKFGELEPVFNSKALYYVLKEACGLQPGQPLTEDNLRLASETAFNAVFHGLIANPTNTRDPITQLDFPPKPRAVTFQTRGRTSSGRRMTYDEYLANEQDGWGAYTKHHLLLSSWLNELDRPLYQALMYQANRQADEDGIVPAGPGRVAAQDAFFWRLGVMTPGHLIDCPTGFERQRNLLVYVRKLQAPISLGRRPDGGR